jgi:signal transduction histidine kinase
MSLSIDYEQVLRGFLSAHREIDLMNAYELGKHFQNQQISPDELIGMHLETVERVTRDLPQEDQLKEIQSSFSVLIEMMIAYGIAYSDAYRLLERTAREAEDAKFELERTIVELDLANQQLQDLARLKDQFFANMSHELRTPLNSIIGFAEDAIDGLAGELSPKQHRYVSNILSAGRHLLSVINDILDLAKLQSGKTHLELETVELHRVLGSIEDTLQPLLVRKQQTLHMPDGLEQLPKVLADPEKLYQILLNLTSNAYKFTPEGGRITVEAHQEGDMVVVTVADTGIGIPAESLAYIFEELRQVDSLRTTRQQGTGLGLAITRRLVEMHGGDISITSVMNEGSRFTFSIPVAGEEASV